MIDKSLIGRALEPVAHEVEKGAIRRFAEALDDPNPLYRDEAFARAEGYRGVIAPLTFAVTLVDADRVQQALNLTQHTLLQGEQSFEYYKPITAGDVITVQSKVSDVHERPGSSGVMTILVIEDQGLDAQREPVFTSRRHYVVRRT